MTDVIGGEQLTWDVPLNGSGANAGYNFTQEGILFSVRIIPLNGSYAASGTPTVTLRNGNDVVIDAVQFAEDTTGCPTAEQLDNAFDATGLRMPYLFVGQSTVVVSGGAANGYVRIILKMYP